MKIKEFIRALGYSLTYNEDITITIGSNDVRFIYDHFRDVWEVIIKDFEGHLHRIAVLTTEDSVDPDRYSTWCDQEIDVNNVNYIPFNPKKHCLQV